MRIRHLLTGGMVLALVMVLWRLAMLELAHHELDKIDRVQLQVDQVSRNAAGLLVLSQDYLLHTGRRASRQWHATQEEVATTLIEVSSASDDLRDDALALREVADSLPALFSAIEVEPTGASEDVLRARRELLADHLLAETRRISDGAFSLAEKLADLRRIRARDDRRATLATIAVFAALVVLIAAIVLLRVLRPMAGLQAAVRGVSAGDPETRSRYRAADEFGELSRGFDDMAVALQDRGAHLELARRHLQNILDATPSAIGYWDLALRNRFANHAYLTWFGLRPEAVQGVHLRDLLGNRYPTSEAHAEAALRGEARVFEMPLPMLEGGERNTLTHYVPDIVNGEVRGFYAFQHDITQQAKDKARLAATLHDNEALLNRAEQAARRLQESEAFLDRTGRVAGVGGWELNIPTGELVWSEETRRILGVAPDSVPTVELAIRLHAPEARVQIVAALEQAMSSGEGWDFEVPIDTPNGRRIWARTVGEVEHIDGTPRRIFGAFQDVTQRHELEERLAASERFVRQITDGVPMRIAYLDRQGRYRFVNMAHCRRFQRDREAIIGHTRNQLTGRSDPEAEAHLRAAFAGQEQRFEYEEFVDGQLHCIESRLTPDIDEQGQVRGIFTTGSDITERKEAERELRATSTLLNAVLGSASEVSIIATDPQQTITVFNTGAEALLGYTRAEMVGCATPLAIHDALELQARSEELTIQQQRPITARTVLTEPATLRQPREWTYLRKNGSRVTVSTVVTAMLDADGQALGYLHVAHDVTRQKQYEQTLRLAMQEARQASVAKGQFLANMSHEIRTPLNAVIGLTHLLGKTELDTDQAGFVSKIGVAGKSLLSLISGVLDLSKVEAGELVIEQAPFSIAQLLHDLGEVVRVQADEKGIDFRVEAPDDLPAWLDGDATRLAQVLTNLLANAVKFTEQGAVVLRVLPLHARPGRCVLRFEVQDSGIGIAPDVQAKLFAPFVQADASMTRRFGGTGLGLSIVKRLVSLMGGEIVLNSQAGVGSEFSFQLDLSLAEEPQPSLPRGAHPHAPHQGGLQGVRVLVVDDSDINRDVARRILEAEGAQVELAGNGEEACVRLQAGPDDFDAVIMDVQMPVLDGFKATRRIRDELALKGLPVIALTAGALTSERRRAKAAGMDDFVTKPFDPYALVRCIQHHTLRPHAARPRSMAPLAEPAPAAPAWPAIDGIDTNDAFERLSGDWPLFRSMLGRLLNEFAAFDAHTIDDSDAALQALAARVHKLRGTSGMLGARAVQRAATEVETACREGQADLARLRAERLADALQRLNTSASPHLSAASLSVTTPVATSPAPAATPAPGSADDVKELSRQLQQQSLAALTLFRQLGPSLRELLGPDYEPFSQQIENLQFNDARKRLEDALHSKA